MTNLNRREKTSVTLGCGGLILGILFYLGFVAAIVWTVASIIHAIWT